MEIRTTRFKSVLWRLLICVAAGRLGSLKEEGGWHSPRRPSGKAEKAEIIEYFHDSFSWETRTSSTPVSEWLQGAVYGSRIKLRSLSLWRTTDNVWGPFELEIINGYVLPQATTSLVSPRAFFKVQPGHLLLYSMICGRTYPNILSHFESLDLNGWSLQHV